MSGTTSLCRAHCGGWGTGHLQGRLGHAGGPFLKSQSQSGKIASPLGELPKAFPAVLTPEELGAPHPRALALAQRVIH